MFIVRHRGPVLILTTKSGAKVNDIQILVFERAKERSNVEDQRCKQKT